MTEFDVDLHLKLFGMLDTLKEKGVKSYEGQSVTAEEITSAIHTITALRKMSTDLRSLLSNPNDPQKRANLLTVFTEEELGRPYFFTAALTALEGFDETCQSVVVAALNPESFNPVYFHSLTQVFSRVLSAFLALRPQPKEIIELVFPDTPEDQSQS